MSAKMHYGATAETFQIAERLRRDLTIAEKLLWDRVCKNQLGVRIRRQHPIWKFIADFYCHEIKLVIEIDWEIHYHPENKEYDISRDKILKEFQIEILRFTNDEVISQLEYVIEKITKTIEALKQKLVQKPNQGSIAG